MSEISVTSGVSASQQPSQPAALEAELRRIRTKFHAMKMQGFDMSVVEALHCGDRRLARAAWSAVAEDLQPIEALLRSDPRFPKTDLYMGSLNGSGIVFPQQADQYIASRALRTSPEEAVAWFLQILSTPSATGKYVCAIWGVDVASRIELDAEAAIVPLSDLPESSQKTILMAPPNFSSASAFIDMFTWRPPTSALVAIKVVDPLIFDINHGGAAGHSDYLRLHEKFSDIVLSLTAIGPRAPLAAMAWWNFDDPDIREADMQTDARFGAAIEIVPRPGPAYPPLNPTLTVEVANAFLRLTGEVQSRTRLALRRLGQALRRHDLGDKAIELAIALETLTADGDSNEVSHKVKIRATKILGGDGAARARNAKLIAETYNIRSKQMHTGAFDATKARTVAGVSLTPAEILDQAAKLCADLILATIHRGSIPAWATFDIDVDSEA
jgi:hypothetical protein